MKRLPWPWLTGCFLLLAALAALAPAELLEYDRARVATGEPWRLVSGQLVHWTPRMATFDLGVILVLGIALELAQERRLLGLALGSSLLASGLALHLFEPRFDHYRGSSGVAAALFTVVALLGRSKRGTLANLLVALALLGLAGKLIFEATTAGSTLFAAPLPPEVRVAFRVHLAGILAGGASTLFMAARRLPPL